MENSPHIDSRPGPDQKQHAPEQLTTEQSSPKTISLRKAREIIDWTAILHCGLFHRLDQLRKARVSRDL